MLFGIEIQTSTWQPSIDLFPLRTVQDYVPSLECDSSISESCSWNLGLGYRTLEGFQKFKLCLALIRWTAWLGLIPALGRSAITGPLICQDSSCKPVHPLGIWLMRSGDRLSPATRMIVAANDLWTLQIRVDHDNIFFPDRYVVVYLSRSVDRGFPSGVWSKQQTGAVHVPKIVVDNVGAVVKDSVQSSILSLPLLPSICENGLFTNSPSLFTNGLPLYIDESIHE